MNPNEVGSRASARRLDRHDVKILEMVQVNGRISKKALADGVGLSLTPCFQRLRRLERLGFIRGYRGVVDARRFGSVLYIYMEVALSRHRAADFARFEEAIRELPEAIECDAVGGGIDYVVRLIVRDVSHYQQLVDELLERDIGVGKFFTRIVTKRVKDPQALPIAALLGSHPVVFQPATVVRA